MKLNFARSLLVAATLGAGSAMAADLNTDEEKLGYIIGMDIGNSLKTQGTDIDLDALFDAIRTVYNGDTPAMTQEEAAVVRQAFIEKRRTEAEAEKNALSQKNLAEGEAFLAENRNKAGVQVTESGLQYMVKQEGTGAKPVASDRVTVHYRGALLDGTEFDSSYSRGQPATFELDKVIAGWTEGVQLMSVGSQYTFYIPPSLAYGENGGGPIGPNATLVFDVELVGIEGKE